MLKPAPPSLRELPRAPPGSLPPPPLGHSAYGMPPTLGGGTYGLPPRLAGGITPLSALGGAGLKPVGGGYAGGGGGGGGAPRGLPGRQADHQTGLTPSLLQLFIPRPPVEYMPAPAKPKKTQAMTGA
jgi:U1 small nuclear ribonucleoprotein